MSFIKKFFNIIKKILLIIFSSYFSVMTIFWLLKWFSLPENISATSSGFLFGKILGNLIPALILIYFTRRSFKK